MRILIAGLMACALSSSAFAAHTSPGHCDGHHGRSAHHDRDPVAKPIAKPVPAPIVAPAPVAAPVAVTPAPVAVVAAPVAITPAITPVIAKPIVLVPGHLFKEPLVPAPSPQLCYLVQHSYGLDVACH